MHESASEYAQGGIAAALADDDEIGLHESDTIYAGDYPILLQSTTLPDWVAILDQAFADLGLSEADTRKIYRDNAIRFYKLKL